MGVDDQLEYFVSLRPGPLLGRGADDFLSKAFLVIDIPSEIGGRQFAVVASDERMPVGGCSGPGLIILEIERMIDRPRIICRVRWLPRVPIQRCERSARRNAPARRYRGDQFPVQWLAR